MALNVEQITTRLAQMPDAALQKYAAMNKNDPYIMALAVSESNRRKQMRQAAQAQQGQAPQPKVVDAAVQSMAAPMPEDTGIARLPAGDMNFADGGIVAFADGGEVERYNGTTGSLTGDVQRILQKPPQARTPEENAMLAQAGYDVQTRTLGPDSGVSGVNTFLQNIGPRMRNYFTAGASRLSDEELAKQPGIGGAQNERILRAMGIAPSTTPLEPQASYSNEGRREPMASAAPAAPAAPTAKTDTTKRGTGSPGAPGTAGAPDSAKKAADVNAGLAALDPDKLFNDALTRLRGETRPEKEMIEQLNRDKKSAAEKELESERALEKRFADAFKGRRERLTEREGELGRMKDQNFGLALLQAGAAIMSTPGSVGKAVGRGIQAGSQQYVAGIDKLNAAKDRLADARDRLDDLQLNRDEMSARSIQKAENKIRDTAIAGQENMIRYIMERDKVDRETATKILDTQILLGITQSKEEGLDRRSQNEIQGRITAANIAAGSQREYVEALRGGTMVETARKNIMNEIIKANPHADEPTRQMLFQREWTKALQNNPALAKYSGVAPGGGGAASADPLGLRQ